VTDRPPTVEELRALADTRVRAQIETAKQRRTQQQATRTEFQNNRNHGLTRRHQTRQRLAQETEMAPQPSKPTVVETVCPSCGAIRRCRPVGTATIGKLTVRVLQCPEPACELQWCPPRPRFTTATAA
jgi:hypothetical protein